MFEKCINSLWFDLFFGVFVALVWWLLSNPNPNVDLKEKLRNFLLSCIIGGSIPFLVKLYTKLGQTVPTVTKLQNVIKDFNDIENRLVPIISVAKALRPLNDRWNEWHDSFVPHKDLGIVERKGLTLLAEEYLLEESSRIASKCVLTNTKRYTKVLDNASDYLNKYLLDNGNSAKPKKVLRYHITGMLPEEFYNGPQIEFTSQSSEPIFFCHRWENYNEFYDEKYKGLDKVTVKRCIVVRQPTLRRDEFSALSTLDKLKEQADLSIMPRERRVFEKFPDESESEKKRLFRKCSFSQQEDYKILIDSLLGRQKYTYLPIIESKECCKNEEWSNLLEYFSKDFHKYPNNALYCALGEKTWEEIKNSSLKDCFRAGFIPEIALFCGYENGKEPNEWYFGIVGHWRPFTPEIELQFLNSEQTKQLFTDFTSRIYEKSRVKGKLLEIKESDLPNKHNTSVKKTSFNRRKKSENKL